MNNKGMIIAFEGLDGSGKETQTKLITRRLQNMGIKTLRMDFPNYDNEYSLFVKKYLNGEFEDTLSPYVAAMFYSLDRLGIYSSIMKKYLEKGYIIICDRYVHSNLIYQGAKIENLEERDKFFNWVLDFEYNKCDLFKQKITFFIDMPIDISLKFIRERNNHDIHEKNEKFLRKCYENCIYLSKKYGFINIDCVEMGKLLSIEDINDKIFKYISKVL